MVAVNFGVWLVPLTWASLREARRLGSIRRAALAGVIVWCAAVSSYYLYYTVLLAFWGLPHMEHLLIGNLGSATYCEDWIPAFKDIILNQFLDWIWVAVVGGAAGGGLVGFFYLRLRSAKRPTTAAVPLISTILILSMPLLAALFPHPAYACSCAPPGTPQEALARADAVFAGEVVAIHGPITLDGFQNSGALVTFAVDTVWKGTLEPELHIATPLAEAGCGYSFTVGEAYMIYAFDRDAGLQTHLCTCTQQLDAAAGDLAALGPGSIPLAPEPAPTPTLTLLTVLNTVLLGGALLHRRD